MTPSGQDNLDLLLREHLRAELDGQLGRAPAAFARSSRRRPWRVVGVISALAAAAALLAIVLRTPQRLDQPARQVAVLPTTQPATSDGSPVEVEIAWQTEDSGTVLVGDDPMRSVRQRQVASVRWNDPALGATIEVRVPDEQVTLVELNTY